jgi:hypothetical protein
MVAAQCSVRSGTHPCRASAFDAGRVMRHKPCYCGGLPSGWRWPAKEGPYGPGVNNMTGLGTGQTPLSTSRLPPAPGEAVHTSDVWVSLSIAAVLSLTAATIGLWPTEQRARTSAQSEVPTLSTKEPLSDSLLTTGPFGPTRFENPFDASEIFEFPAGTSADAARESVAQMLLQRARERQARISSVKHMHSHPSAPLQTPALMWFLDGPYASKMPFPVAETAAVRWGTVGPRYASKSPSKD